MAFLSHVWSYAPEQCKEWEGTTFGVWVWPYLITNSCSLSNHCEILFNHQQFKHRNASVNYLAIACFGEAAWKKENERQKVI